MPFIFQDNKDITKFTGFKSVLIVPCRFCPAASSAVRNNEPYFKFFSNFLKTDSYEKQIKSLKLRLEEKGVRTGIFKSRLIHQFVLCMWTSKRRKKLLKRAKDYEAIVVLGCEAAVQTVRDSLKSSSCEVIPGLESEGVMSIQPRFHLPCNLSLKLESITTLSLKDNAA